MLELWQSFLELIPNVVYTRKELLKCIIQTLQMVGWTTLYSAGFGVIFGVTLVVTQKDGILECKPVYQILDKLINVFRSIPFVILVALLIKMTRMISGTSIGTKGMIFPMIVATVPFLSRQIHSALVEIDPGMIEAAQSMGCSPLDIIWRVYLREGLPGMIRGATITIVNVVTITAMAGYVGGGGLGDYAIRYGWQRAMTDVTIVTIIIILAIVTIIQTLGGFLARKLTH
ncbi:MAG: ABC transporter permease [Clostridia bacterium]|nr:ABC transporter permease [Clostridia bacterium]